MGSRSSRRLILIAVLAFFAIGLFFIEQRPKAAQTHLLTLFQDLVSGPAILPNKKIPDGVHVPHVNEAAPPKEHMVDPCTVLSPLKGFIDLRGLSSAANDGKAVPWVTKGFDLGHNYSIGVCLSPVKKTHLNAQVKDGLNALEVGAFYVDPSNGEYILMGQYSVEPVFRGRKLTLTYENGSYCDLVMYSNGEKLRRKTILTFTCDREMMTKAHVSYVAAVDECTYLFEIRSHYACPTAAKADNLAAIWIFLLIFLAALLVYFSGGFLYRHLKKQPREKIDYTAA